MVAVGSVSVADLFAGCVSFVWHLGGDRCPDRFRTWRTTNRDAPRLTWLLLLMPLALLRVVGDGAGKKWMLAWKYAAVALLLLCLIPFVARQLQGVIYPQLETAGTTYGSRSIFELAWLHGAPRYADDCGGGLR